MRKRKVYLTRTQVEAIRRHPELTTWELGKSIGVHPSTITNFRKHGHKPRTIYLEDRIEIAQSTDPVKDLAADWGMSIRTIYQIKSWYKTYVPADTPPWTPPAYKERKIAKRWRAKIQYQYQIIYLGWFATQAEAAAARDAYRAQQNRPGRRSVGGAGGTPSPSVRGSSGP